MVPAAAGKGVAATFAREACGFAEARTMVAGDGWNDVPMFWGAGRERGTLVGNAEAKIVAKHKGDSGASKARHFLAKGFAADAVMEGMRHFGLAPPATDGRSRL